MSVRDELISEYEKGTRDLRGFRAVGEDLSGVMLADLDFSSAFFERSSLKNCVMERVLLRGVHASQADIQSAMFLKCEFDGVGLVDSNLWGLDS